MGLVFVVIRFFSPCLFYKGTEKDDTKLWIYFFRIKFVGFLFSHNNLAIVLHITWRNLPFLEHIFHLAQRIEPFHLFLILFIHFTQTYMQLFCNWNHSLCTIDNCCEFVFTDLWKLRSRFMVLQLPLWSCSCGWVPCDSQWVGCVGLQHICCSTSCSLHSYSDLTKQAEGSSSKSSCKSVQFKRWC